MVYNIKTSNIGFIDDVAEPKQDDINYIFTKAPTTTATVLLFCHLVATHVNCNPNAVTTRHRRCMAFNRLMVIIVIKNI